MFKPQDYSELVEQAANGDKQALSKLAEAVHTSLKSYVLRITLSEDTADEIVQGTILEMYKIFGQLKNKDSFWPWLCKIALNRIRTNSTRNNRQRHLLEKHAEHLSKKHINIEGLTNVINKEIKQAIFQAMSKLNDQQKAILSLRCFENLSFAKIAYVMDLTEFNSRIIFHRAKKKLQKHLCNSGFTKKNLLPALIIFGKLTAPSEAAASTISITPAMLSTGGVAAAVAVATTKTAMVLTAAGAIALTTVTHSVINNGSDAQQKSQNPNSAIIDKTTESGISFDGYYYYPNGSNGPVMTRLTVSKGNQSFKVLQNDHGNYIQSNSGVVLQNQHYWNEDLSVMTLPADDRQLKNLLGSACPGYSQVPEIFTKTQNLLFAASKNPQTGKIDLSVHKYDAMMEERFQYNWPSDSTVIDNRDDLHKQQWAYVTMKGSCNGRNISGIGHIPFTYSANKKFPAAMVINIANETAISVSPQKTVMETPEGTNTYPPGTFFAGINKPWMGLHCIDTVRRDAARNGIPFKTELLDGKTKSKVSLLLDNTTIVYTINMKTDLIEEITFQDHSGNSTGNITFEYSTAQPEGYNSLKVPANTVSRKTDPVHWLMELASGNL